MANTFELFKQILTCAVTDPGFVRENTIMQKSPTPTDVAQRISSLTSDVVLTYGNGDVCSSSGDLVPDDNTRELVFDPASAFSLSNYRQGSIQAPGRFWTRVQPGVATPPDGIRYLCCDAERGVVLLDENLNLVGIRSGFVPLVPPPTLGAAEYSNPQFALTWTEGDGTEKIAIAMGAPFHIVRVWNWTTGAVLATYGTLNSEGLPLAGQLATPTSLAFDTAKGDLYIGCQTGNPPDSTSPDQGYIARAAGGSAIVTGTVDLSTLTYPTDVTAGTLVLRINGRDSTEDVTLTVGTPATLTDFITELNTQLTAASAGVTANTAPNLQLTTAITGPTASIEIVGGTLLTIVGLVAGTSWGTSAGGSVTLLDKLRYLTDGSLLRGEVTKPRDLEWDSQRDLLWILNGNDEIGAVEPATSFSKKFFHAIGNDYRLQNVQSIKISPNPPITQPIPVTPVVETPLVQYLYVANSDYGNVVKFDVDSGALESVFGTRALEDNALSQQSAFWGTAENVTGVVPDTITVGTQEIDVFLTSDQGNRRIQRVDEEAFQKTNQVTYLAQAYTVPLVFHGWSLVGDIPLDMVTVEWRLTTVDTWRVLDQITHTPEVSNAQFRITVALLPNRAVRRWTIKQLTILAEQA